jgi:hypothetical protein
MFSRFYCFNLFLKFCLNCILRIRNIFSNMCGSVNPFGCQTKWCRLQTQFFMLSLSLSLVFLCKSILFLTYWFFTLNCDKYFKITWLFVPLVHTCILYSYHYYYACFCLWVNILANMWITQCVSTNLSKFIL